VNNCDEKCAANCFRFELLFCGRQGIGNIFLSTLQGVSESHFPSGEAVTSALEVGCKQEAGSHRPAPNMLVDQARPFIFHSISGLSKVLLGPLCSLTDIRVNAWHHLSNEINRNNYTDSLAEHF
jgi:hypothetical protein